MFCSGANIFMLGLSSHAWKVNFCKFTNETRNGIEDSSGHSGLKFIAAVNGACAGGGYELALACDEIMLVDDRSSSVSLPEVPLLGVLPGTGGLTRLTDKRHVRHDLADIFCTTTEGVRGQQAKDWRLVDAIAKPAVFAQTVRERALELAQRSDRPAEAKGVALTPLEAQRSRPMRCATNTSTVDDRSRAARRDVHGARAAFARSPTTIDAIVAAGAAWWPLQMARELDDAILSLRTNELDIGTWLLKTEGDAQAVLAADATLLRAQGPLVRPRDDRAAAAHVRAPRCVVAHAVRADRARLVLRRHAARARAGGRPQLHACAARRRGSARRRIDRRRSQLRPATRWSPDSRGCSGASTRRARRSRPCAAPIGKPLDADAGAGTRPRHVAPRRHRLGRRIRIALEERASHVAGCVDRTGSEPALRRHGDDGDARCSAGCPPGRTGSSSARTRSAKKARSRSTARARSRSSTGNRV